ncbi:hypothetical protein GCM10014719_47440 [Planomonospora parontospora subsp. antibiotica]|nr:hypothetical protein GCM10014719_47440 [Planomonospora parontospora subsp. antibiotica]GII18223.1 hypothetical protein Ppa05_49490 [Planomonospora parontospora subsp. antibiotica]
MNDVRVAGPARANFRAGRLVSYAFSVEATIGQNPMRYVFARRFSGPAGRVSAVTALFVLKPDVLFGTYVWIDEDPDLPACRIHTYLPTMRKPIQVVDRLAFDCLPLTDIGYLDLMAWPHPALRLVPADPGVSPVSGTPGRTVTRCYTGPAGLRVNELLTPRQGLVVCRTVHHGDQEVRRWEVVEQGSAEEDWLPRRLSVARLQSGHRTDFIRTSPALPISHEAFDAEPQSLRDTVEQRLHTWQE